MEPQHRQALQRHLVDFMEDVDVDAGIIHHLQAAGVINNVMVDEINAYESTTKRTLALVQMLTKRGHKAFATFVDALRRTGHEIVAERLMKDVNFNNAGKPMRTTSPVYLSRRQDAQRIPQPHEPIAPPSSPMNVTITEDSDFEQDLAEQHLRMKAYPMEKTVLGACLIINNHLFNDTTLNRSHAKQDAKQLQQALQNVGFKVLHKQNLTAKEMQQTVTMFCQSDRHHRSNCAMVVVISHATASGILGTDGALYSIHALISAVCDVPSLLNKPKVFIFDACIGDEEYKELSGKSRCSSDRSLLSSAVGSSQSGLWSASRPQSGMLTGDRERTRLASAKSRTFLTSAGALAVKHLSTTSYSGFLNHNFNGAQAEIMDTGGPESQDGNFMSLVPATTDIFLMRSKVEQLVAWKNVVEGCVLVQCFARVLTNYHKNTDMFGLYKMTKELVAMKEFRVQDEDGRLQTYRQSVEAVDRLKHILYFRFKPEVKPPSPNSTIEVIDLDQYQCTSPRENTTGSKGAKKSTKHVKFDSRHEVIPTDSKGRVLSGTEKVKTKFCVIL